MRVTFVRWDGPEIVRVPECGLRVVHFEFRLSQGQTWPRGTHLVRSADQPDKASYMALLSVEVTKQAIHGECARFSIAIDASRAPPGHFILWFHLAAAKSGASAFTGDSVVFDEFLVAPNAGILEKAYLWAEDASRVQVRVSLRHPLLSLLQVAPPTEWTCNRGGERDKEANIWFVLHVPASAASLADCAAQRPKVSKNNTSRVRCAFFVIPSRLA